MPNLSVSGLSSGIDFASLTTKIIAAERVPLTLMEAKQQNFQDKLTTLSDVQTKISALGNVADSMKSLADLSPISGSFANNNATDTRGVISILSSGLSTAQDFNITVNQLARSHRIMSAGLGSGETLQQGTFSVTVDGQKTNFTIATGGQNNTLEKLKNSINDAKLGVNASIIDSGSGSKPFHLVLTSDTVGSAHAITTQHNAVPFLVFGSDVSPNAVLDNFQTLQAAQDAKIQFEGQTVTRDSNTISDLIANSTIQLQNAGSGTISFARNDSSLKDKILEFVNAHNDARDFISKNTSFDPQKFDPANKPKLPLFGDSTLLGVLSRFTSFTTDPVTGLSGNFTSLASIGITTDQNTGGLTVDTAKLDQSIADNPDAVVKVFSASGATSNSNLTFVDHTRDTSSGTYTVFLTGTDASGNVQGYFEDPAGNRSEATGSGRFLTGSTGQATGLLVRIDENATSGTQGVGTTTFSPGVAEKFSTEIHNLSTFGGRIFTKTQTIQDSITENAKKIKFQDNILKGREAELKRRFAVTEGTIGKLQSQGQFLSNQLFGLQSSFGGRRRRF